MAIIVGLYDNGSVERCPRPGCKSVKFTLSEAGGKICSVCNAWFGRTRKFLPRPFRPPDPVLPALNSTHIRFGGTKQKYFEINGTEHSHTQDVYNRMRTERRGYKNVRVFYTPLATSPTSISNVRCIKRQGAQRRKDNKDLKNVRIGAKRHLAETSMDFPESTWMPSPTTVIPIAKSPEVMDKFPPSSNFIYGSEEKSTVSLMQQTDEEDLSGFATLQSNIPLDSYRAPSLSGNYLDIQLNLSLNNSDSQVAGGLPRSPVGETSFMGPTRPIDMSYKTEKVTNQDISFSANTAQTTISEPYWVAGSDSGSVCTAKTAPSKLRHGGLAQEKKPCLRCRFFKQPCDGRIPCNGCLSRQSRLWQVPCTRLAIKDFGYFLKGWKRDYERSMVPGISIHNIRSFEESEVAVSITHGYGCAVTLMARKVNVHDERCFQVEWKEFPSGIPLSFNVVTEKLVLGYDGIPATVLSNYLDRHIDDYFEIFLDNYYQGMPFIIEFLRTAYGFYLKKRHPLVRKGLKLIISYNLTLHKALIERTEDTSTMAGKIIDTRSELFGRTLAPAMISSQIKCDLANKWRELQGELLRDLSSLYSEVDSRDKLKNWVVIFLLSGMLLIIWEEIQFICYYDVADATEVEVFCTEMESIPVNVIVSMFHWVSRKLPHFTEWDTQRHSHLLNYDQASCTMMAEMRLHTTAYLAYLKSRVVIGTRFDRQDFFFLANKFLSRLVLYGSVSSTHRNT